MAQSRDTEFKVICMLNLTILQMVTLAAAKYIRIAFETLTFGFASGMQPLLLARLCHTAQWGSTLDATQNLRQT